MAADLHPRIVAAQRELLEAAGARAAQIGWKVGHDIPEVCELAGAQPVVGCLTAATLLADGATYTAGADVVALRGETEVVIELAEAIVADASTAEIERAIAGVGVALELVDVGRPPDTMEGIVVANVFHRAVVFGAIHRGATPRGRDAALTINGTRHDADKEPIEIAETIRSVARVLAACGARLRPGDRIIGGSLAHVPVGPGDDVVAAIDGLGEVRARVA